MEESKTAQRIDPNKGIHSDRKPRGIWFYVARVSVVGLALLIVLGIVGTLTGTLAIVVKSPNSRITTVVNVCDADAMNKFNAAMDSYYDGYPEAVDKVAGVVDDFSKQSGYEGDPNCVYIKYRLALLKADPTAAQAQIDILSKLTSERKYIDARLYGVTSIDAMRATVASMVVGEKESDD